MQTSVESQSPWPGSTPTPRPARKRAPQLRIDTPAQDQPIALALGGSSLSATSLASDSSDFLPFAQISKPRSLRNMKKLSLSIPSAQSSAQSLALPPSGPPSAAPSLPPTLPEPPAPTRRRPSVASLPAATTSVSSMLHRKVEDGPDDDVAYLDGPIQILPGVWLGNEANARDWQGLLERGIKSILNVAKEVASPFDSAAATVPLRASASTPNLQQTFNSTQSTYYPPHVPSGRPGMHYLKMQWSHGEKNLVQDGFPVAMAFVDQALERGEGVLIHCQCGISRSATMVIALVMRAAASSASWVPPEVWALKGMHAAYAFVKEKSKYAGPNMSLIFQLMEYERMLKGDVSPTASDRSSDIAEQEEEWGRQRRMLDEMPSDTDEDDRMSVEVAREAQALDKAMEDRMLARKSSSSSVGSAGPGLGVGMGLAWKNKYGGRRRAGSIASNITTGSLLSEELVEEEEEEELLGVGGGFDGKSPRSRCSSSEPEEMTQNDYHHSPMAATPLTARPPLLARSRLSLPPPTAPHHQTAFALPPVPATATRSTFGDIGPVPPKARSSLLKPAPKSKRRPAPLGLNILPPVPSSPDPPPSAKPAPAMSRLRTESRKPTPPPLHLRHLPKSALPFNKNTPERSGAATPSQTLFVFPPSPTQTTRTPSTIMLFSNVAPLPNGVPFPATPRVSTMKTHGRTRSFIGVGVPPTPTTACSRVDARGWFGS